MKYKITPTAEIFWMGKHLIPFNFAMRVRVQGSLTPARLETALKQICLRHPLLRTRLTVDRAGQPWLVSDGVAAVPVRSLDGCTPEDWQSQVLTELGMPFLPSQGPFMRLVVLNGDRFTDLALVFSHNCIDGMSGLFITQDLLKLLGEPEIVLPVLLPLAEDLAGLVPSQTRKGLGLQLQCWGITCLVPLAAVFLKLLHRPVQPAAGLPPARRFQLLHWTLDAAQTARLVARCRAEKTSVHAAVSSAFLKADAELDPAAGKRRWLRRVSSPVNLRACLAPTVGERAGLFMSTVTTAANCHPDHPFWLAARELKQRMNRDLAGSEKFTFVWRTHAALRGLHRSDRGRMLELLSARRPDYDLAITNLGRLTLPGQIGSLKIEAIHGPLVNGFPLERTVSLLTFDGVMHMAFIFRDFVLSPEHALRIKTRAMEILLQAVR